MRFKMKKTKSAKQHDDWYSGDEGRQQYALEGVINLGPHKDPDFA